MILSSMSSTVAKQIPDKQGPGHENIKILPHIPYMQDQDFSREEYLKLRERVLIKMENMGITDLRKHIVTEDMWDFRPISSGMYNSDRGAIYGTVSDKKKEQRLQEPQTQQTFQKLVLRRRHC